MNFKSLILTGLIAGTVINNAVAAVAVKKAAPVATQDSNASSSVSSLVPAVLNLVSGVQQLNKKQKDLTAECMPSTQEINFVNNTVKEWAKTGAASENDFRRMLGRDPCRASTGGYQLAVRQNAGTDAEICYERFTGDGNTGMVWENFPRASIAKYCPDGSARCPKSEKTVSDIYDIFNLIDFAESDYTPAEATMAAKLIAKIEKCSYAKLNAKKRSMWGEFLIDTISTTGAQTNTGTIMQSVGGIAGGDLKGGMSSLGGLATQLLDR